ncbi:hypothetical protein CFP56_028009 [Quercus suber]|uniref:Uncharacterized protein n=1 Tax=Quercus suber TaxID=58331 RepID=A0AAW0JVE9_QUESU
MVAVRNTTTSCHCLRRPNIEAIHNLASICNGFQYCHIASVKHRLTCSNDEFLYTETLQRLSGASILDLFQWN